MSSPSDAPMRCYYEVLNVERKATYDEIRSAYKKQALIYHPDKNHGNAEEAATKFKEVQNAYAVLSDASEREWYDAHRESILSGDNDGTCAPDEINLYDYFSPRCFCGYDDTETSFFGVYRRVFDTLIEEEMQYGDGAKAWPRFGDPASPWIEVSNFYKHWKNFNSLKTFAWKDEYKINEIPDRQSRRAAERINMKERSAAKKAYTQLVMELAEAIQRRDPRVAAHKQKQEEEEKAKEEAKALRDIEAAKRRREANEKLWAEAAEREAREEKEREERGDLGDGAVLELLYEKQRMLERLKKSGNRKKSHGRADDALLEKSENIETADAEDAAKFAIHVSKFKAEGSDEDDDVPLGQQRFSCNACKKSFHSEHQWNEHIGSSKHKTKLKQLAARGVDVNALMDQCGAPSASPIQPQQTSQGQVDIIANGGDSCETLTAHVGEAHSHPAKKDKRSQKSRAKFVAQVVEESDDDSEETPVPTARNAFSALGGKGKRR